MKNSSGKIIYVGKAVVLKNRVRQYFRKTDKFSKFKNADLKDYQKFKNIIIAFIEYYDLEEFNLKEIDQYLWQLGKEYFPNKY